MSQRSRPCRRGALNNQVGAVIEQQRDLALHAGQPGDREIRFAQRRPRDGERVDAVALAERPGRPCARRPSASAAPASTRSPARSSAALQGAAIRAGNPRSPTRAHAARRTAARSRSSLRCPSSSAGTVMLAERVAGRAARRPPRCALRLCASIPITITAVSLPSDRSDRRRTARHRGLVSQAPIKSRRRILGRGGRHDSVAVSHHTAATCKCRVNPPRRSYPAAT